MQFSEFKTKLLTGIVERDKHCVKLINNNKKLVQEYFTKDNLNYVKEFIDDLYVPIRNENKKFKVIESVLKHPVMNIVLAEFRNSDILIKICKDGSNKKAAEWLISMDIHLEVQDKMGKTALMWAFHNLYFEPIVDQLLKIKGNHINLVDHDGNTALFHACYTTPMLMRRVLRTKLFDFNHLNKYQENVLLFSAKHDEVRSFDLLLDLPGINTDLFYEDGKSLAMMLVEQSRPNQLLSLTKKKKIDVNYKNKAGDSLVSVYFKGYLKLMDSITNRNDLTREKMYKVEDNAQTLKKLIEVGCDFNCIIDGDGNTPVMAFMFLEDYASLNYLLENCKNIDLSIKNKYGIDANHLSIFIKSNVINDLVLANKRYSYFISYKAVRNYFINNKTSKSDYLDPANNNSVMYALAHNDPYVKHFINIVTPNNLFEKNNKNENVIIVATKLGFSKELKLILSKITGDKEMEIQVNTQDHLGNTALHYAVLLKDKYIVNLLMNNKANPNLKNNNGLSAIDLSKDNEESIIAPYLYHPIPISEMEEQIEKLKSKLKSVVKAKSTDEKVNDYIKNYRITSYQQDYEYLMNCKCISCYYPSQFNIKLQQWRMEVYYPDSKDQNIYLATFLL
ncbi:hypothetical protein PIROE2DRAFT_60071 [Piromyces sp. E2]|nr:hypothetical protein PIROE2DRAFT_60071 [Piromyces sp. E2]|eukprot:OUM65338.1 hypothetical protein PIROE2DRAFT_60071 [Piromyces sp. E2]